MATERYRLSFTTGGLFRSEAPPIARHYLASRDWVATRNQIRSGNLLQVRTAAAALRISKEVVARLEQLDTDELTFLSHCGLRDGGYLLWVAACRRYTLIRDFAEEVLRERTLLLQRQVSVGDYDSFFSSKALWHAELDELAPSTQRKLRQNLFRMLREAHLVSAQLLIQPATLSPALAQLLARQGKQSFLVFPATDHDIQRWLQCA